MRISRTGPVFACSVALAALVAACGGSGTSTSTATAPSTQTSATSTASTTTTRSKTTKTRTAASTTSSSSSTTTNSTTSGTTSSSATPATTTTATSSSITTTTATTRTETAPAFVQPGPGGAALTAALAVLSRRGYSPLTASTYNPANTLRVLVGSARTGGRTVERAFFFSETTYLGTDASAPSASIKVLARSDSEVTLGYAIFGPGAAAPSSVQHVRFGLDMGRLVALDPIPSTAARH